MAKHKPAILTTLFLIAISTGITRSATAENDSRFSDADYEAHVKELKKKAPGDEFTIIITPPFVVIGDETPATVKRRADNTVAWAVKKLKEAYFSKDPDEIIDIWLFKDKASYERNAERLFGKKPNTPFGYFSGKDQAMVMNIDTGGGTLVHEIVHPFVAANFPECPTWFNEGLGSLYEQSGEKDGKIRGYTNWRLKGLQNAIRAKKLPSFKELCATDTKEFYEKDKGGNYAQARYLCYYLQQKDLLQKFYRQFYKNRRDDPTGYKTLQKVLDTQDMEVFQLEWEKYVMRLKYPE
jgi:hypothetical protein